jgi:hypothetical protein
VDNKASISYTFAPRVQDGFSYGLNYGLVGVGSDSSRGTFDNITGNVINPPPPAIESTKPATRPVTKSTGIFQSSIIPGKRRQAACSQLSSQP